MKKIFSVLLAALLSSNLSLASYMGDLRDVKEEDVDTVEHEDPFEGMNRFFFEFNRVLDILILKPVSEIYEAVIPEEGQKVVHSFLSNLAAPVVFVNDVLQGEGQRAGDTAGRFIINSTIGIGGLFDPAQDMFGIEPHTEDFGQTLAVAGVGGDPYLVLPVLGPSSPRDAIGKIVDIFIDPFFHVARHHNRKSLLYVRAGVDAVDRRVTSKAIIERIEKSADPYATMRSLYIQNRKFNISNGSSTLDLESPTPEE